MIVDSEFNLSNSKQYELVVQFYSNGFAYAVFHSKEKKILFVDELILEDDIDEEGCLRKLEETLKKNEFIYAPFYACKVGISTPIFTCIPHSLFEEGSERKMLAAVCHTKPTTSIETQFIPSLEMNMLFECGLQTKLFFKKQFLRLQIAHSFSSLLLTWIVDVIKSNKPSYLLQFEGNYFYVALVNDNKLKCVNAFKYNTPEDFIYYLLFVLETHKVSNLEVELCVFGNIDSHEKHLELLHTYIKQIKWGMRPKNLEFGFAFTDLPVHHNGTLFHLASCE